jgi:hypothetical protein
MISEHVGNMIKGLHPSIHYDMEKYYPEAWTIFIDHKRNYVMNCMTQNMVRGIKEGLYRKDLDVPVVSKIYVSRIDLVFDGILFPPGEYDFKNVYIEMMNYHLRGVVSEKGLKYLTEHYKQP